jgi:DNA-directed RNA polymerase subunit RPC12/RpoP
MPIQFRCASCQQLLGIAKRKAGSLVDCPTCQGKTLVPSTAVENVTPEPPVRVRRERASHERPRHSNIFDRVDVDKLLQKPTRPEVIEDTDSAVAVAPPPVRRKMVFTEDPLLDKQVNEEPQAFPKIETDVAEATVGDDPIAEPAHDEPFALNTVPVLTPSSTNHRAMWVAFYWAAAGIAIGAAFFVGHWIGATRPLF